MARAQGGTRGEPAARRRGLAHPLESLVFLLPLIVLYELASLQFQPSDFGGALDRQDRVVAFQLLRTFFELFGPTGKWMPAVAVVAILLGAQAASHQPWRVRPRAVMLLYAEAVVWAVPVLLVSQVFKLAASSEAGGQLWSNLVLAVGAGIYEELVFRLVLICVIVIIGADLLRLPVFWTTVFGVLASAVLFAAHHHPPVGSEPFAAPRFIFRTLAGIYLGVIFIWRGYGVAAGTHVAYNVVVVSLTV